MNDSKIIGNGFEADFRRLCLLFGIAVTPILDGVKRVAGGGLLPQKQICDWVLSYNGKTALIDTKTQLDGKTFDKSSVNQDQLDKMRPHRDAGVICGYIVYFRNEQKLVFFDSQLLDQDKRKIEDGLLLGSITEPKLRELFNYELKLELMTLR